MFYLKRTVQKFLFFCVAFTCQQLLSVPTAGFSDWTIFLRAAIATRSNFCISSRGRLDDLCAWILKKEERWTRLVRKISFFSGDHFYLFFFNISFPMNFNYLFFTLIFWHFLFFFCIFKISSKYNGPPLCLLLPFTTSCILTQNEMFYAIQKWEEKKQTRIMCFKAISGTLCCFLCFESTF